MMRRVVGVGGHAVCMIPAGLPPCQSPRMAGTHRTPGTPSPSSTQRRVAWWGPVVLLVCVAIWTMGSLPGPPGAAAGVRASSAPPAARTVGVAQSGAPGQAAILSRQLPMRGQVGSVLTGTAPGAAPAAALARCRSEVLAGEAVAGRARRRTATGPSTSRSSSPSMPVTSPGWGRSEPGRRRGRPEPVTRSGSPGPCACGRPPVRPAPPSPLSPPGHCARRPPAA